MKKLAQIFFFTAALLLVALQRWRRTMPTSDPGALLGRDRPRPAHPSGLRLVPLLEQIYEPLVLLDTDLNLVPPGRKLEFSETADANLPPAPGRQVP